MVPVGGSAAALARAVRQGVCVFVCACRGGGARRGAGVECPRGPLLSHATFLDAPPVALP